MIRSRSSVMVVMGATVLMLGACSDDDATSSTEIEAEATEYQFDPDSWEVRAGEEFTVDFTNGGEIEHEWAVLKEGDDIGSEDDFAEDKVLFEVEATPAGESVSESFTVDEAGSYQVICALPGHFDAGMEGTLTVD